MPVDYNDNPTVSLDNQCDVRKYGWGVWFFHLLVRWPSSLFVKWGGRWAKLLIALEVRIPKWVSRGSNQGVRRAGFFWKLQGESDSSPFPASRVCLHPLACGPTSSPSWVALSCSRLKRASVPGLRLRSRRGGESTKSYPLNPRSVTGPWPLGFAEKNSRIVGKW